MEAIIGKLNDGGPVFSYLLFTLIFVTIGIFIWALFRRENTKKFTDLLSSIGWFAFAWGFLGRTFGLIKAFDMVSAYGEVTPSLLAEGLKMALIDPLLGVVVFILARLGIIYLILTSKDH